MITAKGVAVGVAEGVILAQAQVGFVGPLGVLLDVFACRRGNKVQTNLHWSTLGPFQHQVGDFGPTNIG